MLREASDRRTAARVAALAASCAILFAGATIPAAAQTMTSSATGTVRVRARAYQEGASGFDQPDRPGEIEVEWDVNGTGVAAAVGNAVATFDTASTRLPGRFDEGSEGWGLLLDVRTFAEANPIGGGAAEALLSGFLGFTNTSHDLWYVMLDYDWTLFASSLGADPARNRGRAYSSLALVSHSSCTPITNPFDPAYACPGNDPTLAVLPSLRFTYPIGGSAPDAGHGRYVLKLNPAFNSPIGEVQVIKGVQFSLGQTVLAIATPEPATLALITLPVGAVVGVGVRRRRGTRA